MIWLVLKAFIVTDLPVLQFRDSTRRGHWEVELTTMKDRRSGIDLYLENLKGEVEGAALYRMMASAEETPALAEVYNRLAGVEERHAEVWREKIRQAGEEVPDLRPSFRLRLIGRLARRFGARPGACHSHCRARLGTARGTAHRRKRERRACPPRSAHTPACSESIVTSMPHGLPGEAVARLEGRHRATGGNALRAAVLGVNDGLVSNLSLVMGVAGASLHQTTILLTGLAGLMAGAISMALGEWLSVQSSRELYQRQIGIEREELADGS